MKLFYIFFSLLTSSVHCFYPQKSNLVNTNFEINKRPTSNFLKRDSIKMNFNELNGFDIGIPINIFHNLFTNIHYGYDISTPKSVLLLFGIGYYTYGKDRFKDALEYEARPFETKKKKLYEFLLSNREFYALSYNVTLFMILVTLLFDKENYINNIPFIFFLLSSEYYKDIKRNFGLVKSFYVSIMWTFACVILPCALHDHSYDILNYPLDYLPCILTIFATSNLNDIKDIEEDKFNGITTLPVFMGKDRSNMLILLCLALSSFIYGINEHYMDRPLINSLFELQNIGFALVPFINEKKNK